MSSCNLLGGLQKITDTNSELIVYEEIHRYVENLRSWIDIGNYISRNIKNKKVTFTNRSKSPLGILDKEVENFESDTIGSTENAIPNIIINLSCNATHITQDDILELMNDMDNLGLSNEISDVNFDVSLIIRTRLSIIDEPPLQIIAKRTKLIRIGMIMDIYIHKNSKLLIRKKEEVFEKMVLDEYYEDPQSSLNISMHKMHNAIILSSKKMHTCIINHVSDNVSWSINNYHKMIN